MKKNAIIKKSRNQQDFSSKQLTIRHGVFNNPFQNSAFDRSSDQGFFNCPLPDSFFNNSSFNCLLCYPSSYNFFTYSPSDCFLCNTSFDSLPRNSSFNRFLGY